MHDATAPDAVPPRPPLSRGGLDRDHARRADPALLDSLLADTSTRFLPVSRDRGLLESADPGVPQLALVGADSIPRHARLAYLGRSATPHGSVPAGTSIVAALLADEDADRFPDEQWGSLREVGDRLDDLDSALLTTAVALWHWHDGHRHAPLTGERLEPELSGWMLTSPRGPEVFPRTDPAVIVAVVDADDRLLLGSNALWEKNRYSLLAGFVEAGESLEAAVVREVHEESGLHVTDPVYLGSQPWPFPQSLMLGFSARVDPDREQSLEPDGEEILDVRWFTRDELRGAHDILLPGPTSIARWIIERWLGEPLPVHPRERPAEARP